MLLSRMLPSVYRSSASALPSSTNACRIAALARSRCSFTCRSCPITSGMVTDTARVRAALRSQGWSDRLLRRGEARRQTRGRLLDRVEDRGEPLGRVVDTHSGELLLQLPGQLGRNNGASAGPVQGP